VLALIPARRGSKGIPDKNIRPIAGVSPIRRAMDCAKAAGSPWVALSTDYTMEELYAADALPDGVHVYRRPPELCGDEVPMIDVVRHALRGMPEDSPLTICALVQPTAVLREPRHLQEAIRLLTRCDACGHSHVDADRCAHPVYDEDWNDYGTGCACTTNQTPDSVVSVVPLPLTHSPDLVMAIDRGALVPFRVLDDYWHMGGAVQPARRQDARRAYLRDGTVYAFYRRTVTRHGTIYGEDVRPLLMKPEETCPLDTPADWAEAERRLQERACASS
jgi:CMP-N-acetylneuraminic acid synthetase